MTDQPATDASVRKLAEAAGLQRAADDYPNDVAAAVEQAEKLKQALARPTDPAAEPWPPMIASAP
jgi:hypothetical protein